MLAKLFREASGLCGGAYNAELGSRKLNVGFFRALCISDSPWIISSVLHDIICRQHTEVNEIYFNGGKEQHLEVIRTLRDLIHVVSR